MIGRWLCRRGWHAWGEIDAACVIGTLVCGEGARYSGFHRYCTRWPCRAMNMTYQECGVSSHLTRMAAMV